jgi:hypothetical protein
LNSKTKEDISFEEPSEIVQAEDEGAKTQKDVLLEEPSEPVQPADSGAGQ